MGSVLYWLSAWYWNRSVFSSIAPTNKFLFIFLYVLFESSVVEERQLISLFIRGRLYRYLAFASTFRSKLGLLTRFRVEAIDDRLGLLRRIISLEQILADWAGSVNFQVYSDATPVELDFAAAAAFKVRCLSESLEAYLATSHLLRILLELGNVQIDDFLGSNPIGKPLPQLLQNCHQRGLFDQVVTWHIFDSLFRFRDVVQDVVEMLARFFLVAKVRATAGKSSANRNSVVCSCILSQGIFLLLALTGSTHHSQVPRIPAAKSSVCEHGPFSTFFRQGVSWLQCLLASTCPFISVLSAPCWLCQA